MKLTFSFAFFLVFVLAMATSNEKIMKQVASQITKANYQGAADLLEHVSGDDKTTPHYLELASLVYDSLKNYDKAISSYEQLMQVEANANGIVERINFLRAEKAKSDVKERERLEKMKNCTKCKGTGYYTATVACDHCMGAGRVTEDCRRCQGQGKIVCMNCDGSGRVTRQDNSTGQTITSTCSRCNGQGRSDCTNSCNRGKFTEDCKRCLGAGMFDKKIACTQH